MVDTGSDEGIGSPASFGFSAILPNDLYFQRGATLSDALANLIAKNFIARSDVKAIQYSNGAYSPHQEYNPVSHKHDGPRIPWRREDLNSHLSGTQTFGHYLLNPDSRCKLFAFDVDFEKNDKDIVGLWPDVCSTPDICSEDCEPKIYEFDPREAWLDRSHPSRTWQKYQLKMVASVLMKAIYEDLELPCAAAYSGGKGVHVYAFTGLISAADAREGARIVLDTVGGWEPSRGYNFFRSINRDPVTGYPNLSIEVFPKQNSLAGKDLGNLMRIPLGRNQNSKDPTFFIDMRTPMGEMKPADPIWSLTTTDPWADA
jgi:hypothetical protein